jgi:hypothetical protein
MITWLFKFLLKRKLTNDKELYNMLRDADKDLDKLKSYVNEVEAEGREVPSYIRKYLRK